MIRFRHLLTLCAIGALAVLGAGLYLAQPPASDYPVLAKEKHNTLYASDDNGWHEIEDALRIVDVPSDDLRRELTFLRDSQDLSSEAAIYLDEQQDAVQLAAHSLEKDYTILPRGPYTNRMSPGQMLGMRALAEAMAWRGVRHELNDESSEAVRLYLTAIELGHRTMNGGDLNEAFIGGVFQVVALRELLEVLPALDPIMLDHVVTELQRIEAVSIPLGQIIAYDDAIYFELPHHTMLSRVQARFDERFNPERVEASYNFSRAYLLGTRLRAQVTLHERNTPHALASLDEMPGTDSVIVDPTTGNPFQLRPDGTIQSSGPSNGLKTPETLLVF